LTEKNGLREGARTQVTKGGRPSSEVLLGKKKNTEGIQWIIVSNVGTKKSRSVKGRRQKQRGTWECKWTLKGKKILEETWGKGRPRPKKHCKQHSQR